MALSKPDSKVERRGITIIEMVVILAVLALLMALILPAVSSARNTARRIECSSRMRQLGVAFHSYHSSFNCLPHISYFVGPVEWSAYRSILPSMELSSLEQQCRTVDAAFANGTTTTTINISPETAQRFPMFLCPADPNANPGSNFGINWSGSADGQTNGAFSGDKRILINFGAITDGTSNTALASEFLRGPSTTLTTQDPDRSDSRRLIFSIVPTIVSTTQLQELLSRCRDMNGLSSPIAESRRGMYWLGGDYSHFSYNHFDNPNSNSCLNASSVGGLVLSASSMHQIGVNVLFADGSMHFVGNQIDLGVWRALGTRAGSEVISDGVQ